MPKPKRVTRSGYPLPGYNGRTLDAEHCPNCGSIEVTLLSGFTSGQRIAICHECAAHYIVEPVALPKERSHDLTDQF